MVSRIGKAGFDRTRLDAEWAYRKLDGRSDIGPAPCDAEAALLDALRRGALVARGTPYDGTGRRQIEADDMRGLAIAGRGRTLELHPAGTRGQRWSDVTISRDDMVRLWPEMGGIFAAAQPAPAVSDLPAAWTAMQSVAWIALRDTAVVQRAGLSPIPSAGATCHNRRKRPDGTEVEANWPNRPGLPLIWIDEEAGLRAAKGDTGMLATDTAVAALVAALRAGKLAARAVWRQSGERRAMTADEWHSLTLDTVAREDAILTPHHVRSDGAPWPDVRWSDVTIPRDDVVKLWPLAAKGDDAILARATEVMRRLLSETPRPKYDELIRRCRKEAPCTKRVAEEANKLAQVAGERRGRPRAGERSWE